MNLKVDKTLVASIALHVIVIGWGLVTFSTKAFVSMPEDSLPVDVISSDQLAKVMAGMKTGKKENPKPLVEKVAEAKPVDDTVGKIDDKKPPVVTETAPPPQPKVEEKPVEKKPDPPKPVAEKPKEEPKPIEKKQEPPKVDPIAEALKKEEKKPPPKPQHQAAKPPEAPKPKLVERHYDETKIAELLNKRDPTRQSMTGETLNSNASLGLSKGRASDNSATWGSMFRRQVEACWKKPYGGVEQERPEVAFNIRLTKEGKLEAMPTPDGTPSTAYARAYQESALRAIIACQPYQLPAQYFEEWKAFVPVFQERPI